MKNIFTRALALTIVFVLCAVSAFAAPTFGDVTYDLATGTLDVATSGYTAGKSATILVVKDGADLANLANTDIVYIDQVDNAAAAQSYADLPIAERAEAIGADAINIYIGGSEVTAAIPYGVDDGEGNIVPTAIAVAEEEPTPEPVIETAYAVTVAAGEYTSLDEVKAATLTVTKTVTTDGVAAAPVTLAASEYTVAYEDADGTVTITVTITADGKTATTTATYTAPVVDDKTGIKGTVTYAGRNGAVAAKGATIVITDGANIAGYAVANAEGKYEVELPAGTYRAIVNYIRFTATATFDTYAPQIISDIVVADGATTTKDISMATATTGDLDGDGDVDLDDYNALAGAWTGAK